jgi:hypothetical protein
LIAYHNSNGIIVMKKHVKDDHFAFMKRLAKDPNYITIAKLLTNLNASKKRAHVSPSEIFGFLSTSSKFKKDDPT